MTTTLPVGLKPCPFCDGRDIVLKRGSDMPGWDEDVSAHQCRKCEATGPTLFNRRGDDSERPTWNTRPVSAPAPEVGEMTEKLRKKATYTDQFFDNYSLGELYRQAADMLSTLSARLAEVEGERDKMFETNCFIRETQKADFQRAEAAEARIKALEEAIQPHACSCPGECERAPEDRDDGCTLRAALHEAPQLQPGEGEA